jgi:glycerophosphoryl diester phosphodiesterase
VVPRDADGALGRPTSLVDEAHLADGDAGAKGDAFGECLAFFRAGVDGVFTDHADTALVTRCRFGRREVSRPRGSGSSR